jgi:hypothetical protein
LEERKQVRASATEGRASVSKVKEIRDTDVLTQPITLDLDSSRPVAFMDDPDEVVNHERVPEGVRKSIVETYGEAFFREREWTRGQLTRLARIISHPRENITNAIAQICGPNCTMMDLCPYDISGKAPVSERCPIELKTAQRFYEEYVGAVSERLMIDEKEIREDIVLHNMIRGIVESDVIELRLNGTIAEDGMLIDVPAVVNEQTGEIYYKQEESVAMRIKERVARRRDQLFRQLLATPEMAEKYKRKGDQDNVARGAKVLDRLEKAVAMLETGEKIAEPEASLPEASPAETSDTEDPGDN